MNKIKIIALVGKSGSGKSTILHLLQQYNVNEIISCTTRPMRNGEQNGIDYHFLTNEEFVQKIINGDMLEAQVFNTWGYGTAKSELNPDKWNVGVFNPDGIENLLENKGLDIEIFYINTPDKLRLIRQLIREDDSNVKEIIRRYSADDKDFQFLESRFPFTNLDNIMPDDVIKCVNRIAEICNLDKVN